MSYKRETQRKVTRLVEAVAEGQPPKSLLTQITTFERELEQMDQEIEGLEARARLGQLDVARALRGLEPALDAWKGILRGNPVRARQLLRKLIVGPIVMEPLPEMHGYKWKGQLNRGAVLEGRIRWGRWSARVHSIVINRSSTASPHDALLSVFLTSHHPRRRIAITQARPVAGCCWVVFLPIPHCFADGPM